MKTVTIRCDGIVKSDGDRCSASITGSFEVGDALEKPGWLRRKLTDVLHAEGFSGSDERTLHYCPDCVRSGCLWPPLVPRLAGAQP